MKYIIIVALLSTTILCIGMQQADINQPPVTHADFPIASSVGWAIPMENRSDTVHTNNFVHTTIIATMRIGHMPVIQSIQLVQLPVKKSWHCCKKDEDPGCLDCCFR